MHLLRSLGAVALCLAWTGLARAQVPDHLKCYKVKDALNLAGSADLDTPQFGADPGCTISKAKLFCVPATKTNVAVVDRATGDPIAPQPIGGSDPGDRICYKIKCTGAVADQPATDQFGSRTLGKFKASLLCTPAFKGNARFVDNGDGTVTDHQTGLMWEQKDDAGGIHDKDDQYSWSIDGFSQAPDGSAFTSFLATLNGCESLDGSAVSGGFAGHCDWRLPTIAELRTIFDLSAPGCGVGVSPCIDAIFGPTKASFYVSSTSVSTIPGDVWFAGFDYAYVSFEGKSATSYYVRAVRGGS